MMPENRGSKMQVHPPPSCQAYFELRNVCLFREEFFLSNCHLDYNEPHLQNARIAKKNPPFRFDDDDHIPSAVLYS